MSRTQFDHQLGSAMGSLPMDILQLIPDKTIRFSEQSTGEQNGSAAPPDGLKSNASGVGSDISAASMGIPGLLTLRNISDQPVAFKIKTTAPKRYLVRPACGCILAGSSRDIRIHFQPSAPYTRTPDRFLVQATPVESPIVNLTKEFWEARQPLREHKLGVLIASTSTTASAGGPGGVEGEAVPEKIEEGVPASVSNAKPPAPQSRRNSGQDSGALNASSFLATGLTSAGFEKKYNDLVQYCLAVEKEKSSMEKDLESLRQTLVSLTERLHTTLCQKCGESLSSGGGVKTSGGSTNAAEGGRRGLESWQIVAIVVGIVVLLKAFNML